MGCAAEEVLKESESAHEAAAGSESSVRATRCVSGAMHNGRFALVRCAAEEVLAGSAAACEAEARCESSPRATRGRFALVGCAAEEVLEESESAHEAAAGCESSVRATRCVSPGDATISMTLALASR